MIESALHLTFVYGTLKQGGYNHTYISEAQFLGVGETEEGFLMVSLGSYPGIIRDPQCASRVAGELYLISDACLQTLDRLEDEGEEYIREKLVISGYPEPAWCYVLANREPDSWSSNDSRIRCTMDVQIWQILDSFRF